jgi:urea transport system ATP-binding protein
VLKVLNLNVYYGESHVIRNISFDVNEGETIAIMGRNGMGKTTLLKSLIGTIAAKSGSVMLNATEMLRLKSYDRVVHGMAYVPQGRMVFPYLTVKENILSGMENSPKAEIPNYIHETFPVLKEMQDRKGGNLSGGQQQQLVIARALVSNPKVLLLDEPTEGLQPSIIKDIAKALNKLKTERKFSIVVSEQVLSFTMEIADRFLIVEKGEFVYQGPKESVDTAKIHSYLTI